MTVPADPPSPLTATGKKLLAIYGPRLLDDILGIEIEARKSILDAALASSPAPAGLDDLRARIETNLKHAERRPDDDFYRGKASAFRVVLSMLDGPPNPTFVCGKPER